MKTAQTQPRQKKTMRVAQVHAKAEASKLTAQIARTF